MTQYEQTAISNPTDIAPLMLYCPSDQPIIKTANFDNCHGLIVNFRCCRIFSFLSLSTLIFIFARIGLMITILSIYQVNLDFKIVVYDRLTCYLLVWISMTQLQMSFSLVIGFFTLADSLYSIILTRRAPYAFRHTLAPSV